MPKIIYESLDRTAYPQLIAKAVEIMNMLFIV
jgi:hypothetical protein